MLRMIAVLVAILFASASAAQDGYPNSCDPNVEGECASLGYKYQSGEAPFPEDGTRANRLFEMALEGAEENCRAGNVEHCLHLTQIASNPSLGQSGQARLDAIELAVRQSETACTNGHFRACYVRKQLDFGQHDPDFTSEYADTLSALRQNEHEFGETGMHLIAKRILPGLEADCNAGDTAACGRLGDTMIRATDPRNPDSPTPALAIMLDSCISGTSEACTDLATNFTPYALGIFPDRNTEEVFIQGKARLTASCDAGNAPACRAFLFAATDYETRLNASQRACEHGSARECRDLGKLDYANFNKSGFPEHVEAAKSYLTRACDQKDAYSCHMLEHITKM